MTALREAAQQALEAMESDTVLFSAWTEKMIAARTALRAALAQQDEPVQEPFGYLWPTGRHPEFRFTQQKRDGVDGMPLYTAPPQRKPLTEEEIVDAVREADLDWQAGWTLDEHEPNRFTTLARAVEQAHGIKE
jgi:hypothetical protein